MCFYALFDKFVKFLLYAACSSNTNVQVHVSEPPWLRMTCTFSYVHLLLLKRRCFLLFVHPLYSVLFPIFVIILYLYVHLYYVSIKLVLTSLFLLNFTDPLIEQRWWKRTRWPAFGLNNARRVRFSFYFWFLLLQTLSSKVICVTGKKQPYQEMWVCYRRCIATLHHCRRIFYCRAFLIVIPAAHRMTSLSWWL